MFKVEVTEVLRGNTFLMVVIKILSVFGRVLLSKYPRVIIDKRKKNTSSHLRLKRQIKTYLAGQDFVAHDSTLC